MDTHSNHEPQSEMLLQSVLLLGQQVASLEQKLTEIHQVILSPARGERMVHHVRTCQGFRQDRLHCSVSGGATMAGSSARKTLNPESGGFPAKSIGGWLPAGP